MKVTKASLVGILLEVGEENVAVLLARSTLPELLDTERDLGVLAEFGLDPSDVVATARSTVADMDIDAGLGHESGVHLDRTISRRWADLVAVWVSSPTD